MKFSDVIGQEEAIGRLRQLVEEQRVPSTMKREILPGISDIGYSLSTH